MLNWTEHIEQKDPTCFAVMSFEAQLFKKKYNILYIICEPQSFSEWFTTITIRLIGKPYNPHYNRTGISGAVSGINNGIVWPGSAPPKDGDGKVEILYSSFLYLKYVPVYSAFPHGVQSITVFFLSRKWLYFWG